MRYPEQSAWPCSGVRIECWTIWHLDYIGRCQRLDRKRITQHLAKFVLRELESIVLDLGLGAWLGAIAALLADGYPDIRTTQWQALSMAGLALYFWWLAQTERG